MSAVIAFAMTPGALILLAAIVVCALVLMPVWIAIAEAVRDA